MNGTVRKTDKGAIGPKDIPYRVSRARDRAIVLTDDQEDLVEALKAVAGRSPARRHSGVRAGLAHRIHFVTYSRIFPLSLTHQRAEAFRMPCAFGRTSSNRITTLQIWTERGRGPRQRSQLLPSAVDG